MTYKMYVHKNMHDKEKGTLYICIENETKLWIEDSFKFELSYWTKEYKVFYKQSEKKRINKKRLLKIANLHKKLLITMEIDKKKVSLYIYEFKNEKQQQNFHVL